MDRASVDDALRAIFEHFDKADLDDIARTYSELVGKAVIVYEETGEDSDIFNCGFHVQNLDTMDASELSEYAWNNDNPPELREYAKIKQTAIADRMAGHIDDAIKQERQAEWLYRNLPQKMKW